MKRFLSVLVLIFLFAAIGGAVFAEELKVETLVPQAASGEAQPATAEVSAVIPAVAPAPLKIDTGDTAWMIVATALVMLMTIPGLELFYGGLAKRQDALNTISMY